MTNHADNSAQLRVQQAIAAAWQRVRPEIEARVSALRMLAEQQEPDRAEAVSLAHRLAGVLGMYGYPQGTELARELEQVWSSSNPDFALCSQLSQRLQDLLFPAAEQANPDPLA